ncbi:MAG: transposase [Treponema sp.]|jgi:REP element-mobilizing transposase RayT|nr:transposase [Treponema sp.]
MRKLRVLQQGAWYEIRTQINNREPLFRRYKVQALFNQMFYETEHRFVFEVRFLHLQDDWLTFYIKPDDGLELSAIMKWLKQTFAQRYNREVGRIGHIRGDRYWSRIEEGEPSRDEGNGEVATALNTGVRPFNGKNGGPPGFPLIRQPCTRLNGGKPPGISISTTFSASS